VHAALLSTFLVGVGVGSRTAYRAHRWLAAMEVGTGLYALAAPFLTAWLSGQDFLAAITGSAAATIAVTIGLMVPPSLLIGFSVPLFSAYAKARLGDRPGFQGIYTGYNLGAFLGILVVEFVLVHRIGVSDSLAVLGAINLGVGALLLATGSLSLRRPNVAAHAFPTRVVAALAVASTVSAVFQMFFLKMVFLVFGPHRENFALSLAVILLGIGLGAGFASRVKIRFETALVAIPIARGSAGVGGGHRASAPARRTALHLRVRGAADVLLRCTVARPDALRARGCRGGRAAPVGFERRECCRLSVQPLLPSAAVLVGIGLAALGAAALSGGRRWTRVDAVAAALGVVLLTALGLRWSERNLYLVQYRDWLSPSVDFQVFKSGGESVTLVRADPESEWISYNGHPSIWARREGVVSHAELVSGVIPALAAPRLERALVLGLGTGITAGSASRLFESVDVVEINAAFFELLPLLRDANLNVATNPAVALHLADGRAFLNGAEGLYDAIVNSIPAPTYFSASKIYTLEFYQRVRRALKDDGVFCTWLAVTNMSEAGVRVVLSALARSFEHCDLRLMEGDYYMATCSDRRLVPRGYAALDADPHLDGVLRKSLPGLNLPWFFEDIRLSEDIFAVDRPSVARENTDDLPVLEHLVVAAERRGVEWRNLFGHEAERFGIDPARGLAMRAADRVAHRAEIFRRFDEILFEKAFAPILQSDPAVAAAFAQLEEKRERTDRR
jgi:hypothetical protein